MKTSEFFTTDLSNEELDSTTGGFLGFAILAAAGITGGLLCGGILLLPIAAAAYKGWQDYK